MKKCIQCGSKSLTAKTEQLPFNDVALVEGTVYTCDQCAERYEALPRVEELSKNVAHFVAHKEERLAPEEIRFLRTYLGLASKDLAEFLGVAPETVSRWESKTTPMLMELRTEKLLRFMALTDKPIADYGLERAGTKDKSSTKPLFRRHAGTWAHQ